MDESIRGLLRQRAAGILLAGRDSHGQVVILVGKRRLHPRMSGGRALKEMFLGVIDDCWTNPFGKMDTQDENNFRYCAVRETVEEVHLGRETTKKAEEIVKSFDGWAGLADGQGLLDQVGGSREAVSPQPLKWNYKNYFAFVGKPVEQLLTGLNPSWEWVPGTLGWRKPHEVLSEPRVHWGLRLSLGFFAKELASF